MAASLYYHLGGLVRTCTTTAPQSIAQLSITPNCQMKNHQAALVLCLAYVVGLLVTFNPWVRWGLLGAGMVMVWLLPRIWKKSPNWQLLLTRNRDRRMC